MLKFFKEKIEKPTNKMCLDAEIEPPKKLTDIYRESECYDEYMEEAIDYGYDEEEAKCIYYELTFKYEDRA